MANHRVNSGATEDVLDEDVAGQPVQQLQKRAKMAAVRSTENSSKKPEAAETTAQASEDPKVQPNTTTAAATVPAGLTEEQRNQALKEIFGDEFTGNVDELKGKLAKKPEPAKELTAEEKTAKEQEQEKILLDLFLEKGGTIEGFAQYKTVLNADEAQLSDAELRRQLLADGVAEGDLDFYIKHRYFQLSDEELESIDDDGLRERTKQGREIFGKRISAKGQSVKTQAKTVFDTLAQEAQARKTLEQSEKQFSATVDEVVSKVPENFNFSWKEKDSTGEEKDIPAIVVDVLPEDREAVAAQLKNKSERQKIFYNEDGSFNVNSVANLLIQNKILQRAVKAGYREGADRNTQVLKTIFPSSAQAVGLGGNGQRVAAEKGTGKMKSAGQPQRAR